MRLESAEGGKPPKSTLRRFGIHRLPKQPGDGHPQDRGDRPNLVIAQIPVAILQARDGRPIERDSAHGQPRRQVGLGHSVPSIQAGLTDPATQDVSTSLRGAFQWVSG